MSNKYLEKIALTRVVKELAKGTLGEYGSAKAMKSVHDLMQAGAIRSPKVYTAGMKVGNQEIAKKTGQFINKARPGTARYTAAQLGGGFASLTPAIKGAPTSVAAFQVSSPSVNRSYAEYLTPEGHGLKGGPLQNISGATGRISRELGVRHEVIEGRYGQAKHPHRIPQEVLDEAYAPAKDMGLSEKQVSGLKRQNNHAYKDMAHIYSPSVSFGGEVYPGTMVGAHHNLGVLGQESEVVRKNPYLSTLKTPMGDVRRQHGEASILGEITGKKYGSDRYTGKDIKKLESATPSTTSTHAVGTTFREYRVPGVINHG